MWYILGGYIDPVMLQYRGVHNKITSDYRIMGNKCCKGKEEDISEKGYPWNIKLSRSRGKRMWQGGYIET